jgi:hypothetical protein
VLRLRHEARCCVNVAFDIGGVLSKYPSKFRLLIVQLQHAGIQVFVITDMHDVDKIYEMLELNDFDMIPKCNVYSADYKTHGDGCKAELLRELEIDLFFDDHLPYMMLPGDTIQCLVMPTPFKPYWAPEWKVPEGDQDFGRRFYKKGWSI